MSLKSPVGVQTGEGGLLVQSRGKLFSIRFFYSVLMVRTALCSAAALLTKHELGWLYPSSHSATSTISSQPRRAAAFLRTQCNRRQDICP